jgi:hypothetical protein
MNATEYKTVIDFDASLSIGMPVLAKWTNSYQFYQAQAKVIKLNSKTVNVQLTENISEYHAGSEQEVYPCGQIIQCPRIHDIKKWTVHNRLEPVGGF